MITEQWRTSIGAFAGEKEAHLLLLGMLWELEPHVLLLHCKNKGVQQHPIRGVQNHPLLLRC